MVRLCGDVPRCTMRRSAWTAAALTSLATTLVGAAAVPPNMTVPPGGHVAANTHDERVLPQESRLGIEALLSRETARMRESLASAALGSDHSMLLARKRSTDWCFLAAAVTAGIGAGIDDPAQLLASFITCDAPEVHTGAASGGAAQDAAARWPARLWGATPLVAEVTTCLSDPAGTDFPCAIRWRVVHDSRGLVARPLWHEPMVAMRGFDAPLVPDRTTLRLSAEGTDVECWGFGRVVDGWPATPAPLDQVADSYDLSDAARHWWWSGPASGAAAGACDTGAPSGSSRSLTSSSGHGARWAICTVHVPECDVVRTAPWRVESSRHVMQESLAQPHPHIAHESTRASIAVPLRPRPSRIEFRTERTGSTIASLRASWTEGGRWRGSLVWRAETEQATRPVDLHDTPTHAWLDAQARLQLLQHVPTPAVLPDPYSRALVLGEGVDERAAHARATANAWHAAVIGDCASLTQALSDAESLRRRRGLPRSMDAMALATLAESLLDRGAPEASIALVVTRHLLVASGLPPDRMAAHAEFAEPDLMPSHSRQEYAAMLSGQGRDWAAWHCSASSTETLTRTGDPAAHGEGAAHAPTASDALVIRFSQWQARRSPVPHDHGASGAPAAIHARTLAISASDSRSPSGGIARSSSIGRVSTASSELPSGSPGFTMMRPFRSLPISSAGSSSRMPAFDFPRPWHS
jgi:hypothetical protein